MDQPFSIVAASGSPIVTTTVVTSWDQGYERASLQLATFLDLLGVVTDDFNNEIACAPKSTTLEDVQSTVFRIAGLLSIAEREIQSAKAVLDGTHDLLVERHSEWADRFVEALPPRSQYLRRPWADALAMYEAASGRVDMATEQAAIDAAVTEQLITFGALMRVRVPDLDALREKVRIARAYTTELSPTPGDVLHNLLADIDGIN